VVRAAGEGQTRGQQPRRPVRSAGTLGLLAVAVGASVGFPQQIVLRTNRLLDPVTGAVATNQQIVVDGARIASVGAGIPVLKDARVIDLTGLTVLPGLIDAHVHLVIGGSPRDNAYADLRAGFTTVVDLGARSTRLLRVRDSINAGSITGPRVLAAGMWVGTKNGVCEFNGIGISGGADAYRQRVRENVEAGADLIKVCVSGWPAESYAKPDVYEITDGALRAVVDEAHAAHRMVIAHDISRGGVQAALASGVDGLAHAPYLDTTLARGLEERGVFVISTLASLTAGDTSAAARALFDATALAYRTGVRLVFGTDGGVLPHGQNTREFAALLHAGVSPLDAIRAATINAARAFQIADSVGTIAPGMAADIIAVEGDPLTDVGALGRVRFVMSRGRVVRAPD
jgi:imidazolonepropionase-like amidohydrolase